MGCLTRVTVRRRRRRRRRGRPLRPPKSPLPLQPLLLLLLQLQLQQPHQLPHEPTLITPDTLEHTRPRLCLIAPQSLLSRQCYRLLSLPIVSLHRNHENSRYVIFTSYPFTTNTALSNTKRACAPHQDGKHSQLVPRLSGGGL